jgi:shikimate dehydrogenase
MAARSLDATTRVAGVIGDPVRHSLSPLLHNAAFGALDLDWAFLAFTVRAGGGPAALAAMRALRLEGLNVTMPLKGEVADAVDRLGPSAAVLRSVNTVVWRGTELVGESTDGAGLLAALRDDEGFDPAGRRCLVLGSGGAARAVVHALAGAGAARVAVAARRPEAALAVATLGGAVGAAGGPEEADGADLVVDATPVGMPGHDPGPPLDPDRLGPGQLVVDLVYDPPRTPLLEAARARGAATTNGLGMLLHQAALSFRLWTGEDPPLEAMSVALVAELARRGAAADPPPG